MDVDKAPMRPTTKSILPLLLLATAGACSSDAGPLGPAPPPIEGFQITARPYIGNNAVIVISNDSDHFAEYLICGRILELQDGDSWTPAPVRRPCQLLGQSVGPGKSAGHIVRVDEETVSGGIYRYRLQIHTKERRLDLVSNGFHFD